MTDTKFTPGPWEVQVNDQFDESVISSRTRYDADAGYITIAVVQTGFDEPFESEQQANIRLIAAAPEMYALLELLCTATSGHATTNPLGLADMCVDLVEEWVALRAKINGVTP